MPKSFVTVKLKILEYLSRSLGKKDQESANRTLTTGIIICTGLAVVIMVVGLIFVKPLIIALGASEEVYPYAYQYMVLTSGIGLVLTIIFWFGANGLVLFFTPLPEVISQGTIVLRISIFSFLILGPQMLASTGIQAFGKAKEALILSVARQGIVYIPLLFAMQSLLGFNGLIWAQPIADTITLVIGLVFLTVILKKSTKEIIDPQEIDTVSDKLVIYEQSGIRK